MGRLIYTAICSLDGYVNDDRGRFDWAAPDAEVHAFVNDLERSASVYLYGRRLYEVMRYWEDGGDGPDDSDAERDYAALWRAAEKVVYSSSLDAVTTSRTRLERSFDPAAVRALADAASGDVSLGGATLASEALAAGIVDELRLIAFPVTVGGGTRALPSGIRLDLTLAESRAFANGAVFLRYLL